MPRIYKPPTYTQEQIEQMDNSDPRLRSPYNDEWLTYDGALRQYFPTNKLLKTHNVDFDDENNVSNPNGRNDDIELISDQIYAYIDKHSGSDIELLKWIIAHHFRRGITPFRFREILKDIFVKQARFYKANGDLSGIVTVDTQNKRWVDRVVMSEDRHIDPKVKMLLMDLSLCWVGNYTDTLRYVITQEDW